MFETFKKRKQIAEKQGEPDVYTYDEIPDHLKHQILLAIVEGLGVYVEPNPYSYDSSPNANDLWAVIDRVCRKELEFYLRYLQSDYLMERFDQALRRTKDVDDILSLVEIACFVLNTMNDRYSQQTEARGALMLSQNAIAEINGRFKQHGVGYQFENGRIIRVDSQFIHAEIIKPALALIRGELFSKVNQDFLTAHRHYRTGEHKDAVTSANRAFETMLKVICDAQGWTYGTGDRATELISKVRSNGLFRINFDKSFDTYIAMMKSGLPAVRNDAGGHGEGLTSAKVTAEIAQFAINMTATNLVFLGECYKGLSG